MKKREKNKGSAVIEMTLLMPILLGCIYFYIMLFLFFVQSGKRMAEIADCIYEENIEETEEVMMRTEGNVKIGKVEEEGKLFRIHIELRKDKNDPVKNIRRWQLVGDVF